MNLTGLTHRIARIEPIARLRSERGQIRVFGLSNAARPALCAALAEGEAGPLLVITPHPQTARELAEDLRCWSDRSVAFFPAVEALPYERVRLDRTVLAQREAAVAGLSSGLIEIVVTPVRALLQPVQSADRATGSSVLRVGDQVSLERLIGGWLEGGYVEVSLVDEPGTFGRRGGVIDVFPAGAESPARIELFGNEIDSLRAFDPATQRSIASLDQVRIDPVVSLDEESRIAALEELLALDISSMNAEAQASWMDDLARLEAGGSLDELAMFAPYLLAEACSLVECLPSDATILVDGALETRKVMQELADQATTVQRDLVEGGHIPAALKPALFEPEEVSRAMAARRCLELYFGSDPGVNGVDLSGLFSPARLYGGRLRTFVHDVARDLSQRTIVASLQHDRIAELLEEEGLVHRQAETVDGDPAPGVTVVSGQVAEGWSLPTEGVVLLSDHELFGHARSRPVPRRPRAPREAFFAEFSPGDYVVHLEHGIGRFDSVQRMKIDGAEREYALVQYAGTDRLYVPTDQLERLTRYISVNDAAPHLNKLGGGEWQRARSRAKQAATDIAHELIDLYSKRMARVAYAFSPDTTWQRELESSFAFPETADQLRAVEEVKSDMEAPHPMDRLVCADVGYGKTEVAVRAAFKAVVDGKQVAVLVPTTILAQQHFETFSERFGAFPLRVEVLSRFRSPKQQREILQRVASGEIDVLIGTHRILAKDVVFKSLGLLIVDEEQRFGVRHKEQLKKMRESIDVLTLTATPIPRTLHMGLVGIREISVIETPPEGRLPIKTYLQPFEDRLIREAILRELDREGQVYIVHNRVATIEAFAERVRQLVPEARVVVGHGQMDEAQLEKVMLTFAHDQADVLVCSTIIENGLDIPNVNTIIVNHAERLGLTQLYQLRGRVGRSANQAYAYLLFPRDARLTHDAARRMEAVFEAQELGAGFTIAMKDLEIRGAGNLLGAEQSGHATAIGFDLYTRMIAEAVERLRGVAVEEPTPVSVDVPLTRLLPPEYVGNEAERLAMYRRLAAVAAEDELEEMREEMRDRFGPLPREVDNLILSVRIKLLAHEARVSRVSLDADALVLRTEPSGIYDRVSLYKKYGSEAKISTNVLRIPRRLLEPDWLDRLCDILVDMARLRQSMARARTESEPVGA